MKNKVAFFWVVLLVSAVSAAETCYFDTNLGRINCVNREGSALIEVSPSIPEYSYLKTNITPALMIQKEKEWLASFLPIITENVVNGTEQHNADNEDGKAVSPIPVPTKTIAQCQKERENDWYSYCSIMWSQGIQIDCNNTNLNAKNEILNNLAEGTASEQYKCIWGG